MVAAQEFQPFLEAAMHGVHDLSSDQLAVALCSAANAPVVTNGVLGDLTQISYANLSSRNLTTSSSGQTSGTYKLVLSDLTLTASGGSVAAFRYIVIYNDTAASDNLIQFYDYGSALTLADGDSVVLDFDPTNGALQLTIV